MWLKKIPERTFETVGVGLGFIGPVLIALQIRAEWINDAPSTLSATYLAGFLVVYTFWTLYGLRFSRFAVWFGNALGIVLQMVLLLLVLLK